MSETGKGGYTFGDFRLNVASRQLLRHDGTPIPLTPKVFDTLLVLVANGGRVLDKETLIAAIWPNRVVEENNLTQNISALRRVLGASAGDHRFILTEPGQGYRFVEPVTVTDPEEDLADHGSPAPVTPAGKSHEATAGAGSPARIVLVVLVLLALAAALVFGWLRHGSRGHAPPMATLAVLPFKPLLAQSRDDVLQLGMADTLITKLSTNPHVAVRSLDAVRPFAGSNSDAVAAGKTLGVDSVLEGYIQRQDRRTRVNARLLAIPSGAALWTGTFDTDFSDVFAMQDAIAQKVAAALSLRLDRDERRRMQTNYTSNAAAYQLYLEGRYHQQNATPQELLRSIDSFKRALAIDPDYALAWVGLAESHRRQAIISDVDPQLVLPLAKAAALHALKVDDTLAEAYVPLGFIHFWYDWDWAAAEAAFRRGIALQPNDAGLHFGYAALLSNLGRNDEALRESQRARELDPTSPLYVSLEASFVAYTGHRDEAREQIEGVLRSHPDFWIAHLTLGWLDTNTGRYPDAVRDFTRASELSGGNQQAVSMLGFALARAGRRAEARALLDSLLQRARHEYVPATSIATIYCGLGDEDQALTWLERGHAARDVRLTFLKVDHRWDPLRGNPRFVALMQKMRLPAD